MPSDPLILAFDTSAAHCAAALLSGDQVLGVDVDDMARGQAEHLFPLIENLLGAHGVEWPELARIGVGIGPGNFTGIRISVAAARGLAVSLGIPAIGVSSLEVQHRTTPVLATVPAPRDQCYSQAFTTGAGQPELTTVRAAQDMADRLGIAMGQPLQPADLVTAIGLRAQAATDLTPPAPLYIRGADAAPPRDPAPVILP